MFPGIDAFHSYDLVDFLKKATEAIQTFLNVYLVNWINQLFGLFSGDSSPIIEKIRSIALFIAAVLIVGIIYYALKIWELHKSDDALEFATPPLAKAGAVGPAVVNKMKTRWELVVKHVESENPGDWRMAIMEADIMLDEMLDRQGYHGESIGDKLKQVEKSDFNSIDQAWEAHKVRNQIAHEGSDFILTQRRAKEVIFMFEKVFREFYMI
ncbi:MAG: hypothetical protein WCO30_01045 [bacterium]